jgi:hypothetical protein
MLPMYGGAGGQSPVFYNLWMALAALLLLRARRAGGGAAERRALGAMALAGFALTFKQSAAPEAALFGLPRCGGCAALPLPGLAARALALMAAGLAPFALFGGFYALIGHFGAFWQAMVTANLAKGYDPAGDHWLRIRAMAISASPALLLALAGLALPAKGAAGWRCGCWRRWRGWPRCPISTTTTCCRCWCRWRWRRACHQPAPVGLAGRRGGGGDLPHRGRRVRHRPPRAGPHRHRAAGRLHPRARSRTAPAGV